MKFLATPLVTDRTELVQRKKSRINNMPLRNSELLYRLQL